MSWQAYVDTSLVGSGLVDRAVIMSADGTSTWASSPGFNVARDEVQAILGSFTDKNEPRQIMMSGFKVQGQKHMTIRAEENALIGKKGKEGTICVLTKQTIIIAHHGEDVPTPNAANTVETLGDYLRGLGY